MNGSVCERSVPSSQTLHLSSWSPTDFAVVRQFEQIECPQRSNLGVFWRVSNSPLQHRHDKLRSLAASLSLASGSKNGMQNEAEEDIDGEYGDNGREYEIPSSEKGTVSKK